MKLYISPASPFARKVRLVAHEAGLASRVDEIPTAVSPLKPNGDLAKANPLMKLPTLVTDEGFALFDSPVICEYLDSLNAGRKLFPAAGAARWSALRQQAIADGILDAAIGVRYQTALAPKELQWTDWQDGQRTKWKQALDFLEADAKSLEGEPTIGSLSVAATLAWLDFRYGADDWRKGRPALASWLAVFGERPSMLATRPTA
ncbi:MAG: glutathione S-transferase [Rhodocyclaceae bacterium]|jgi:glutathione S-transferase|nr:glutathione S-transferase [Rhodocyclaceae bacterium]MCE2980819.1 glutathione S-transferase [Betaproteobacteria bacterium]MCA3074525.1 glutathione S-transferase [Rhodocyclaceae bacterium]MCA3089535.1 glutathione S-transferase [Rhodocyclaceae bacterium]MCA3093096.1 glutathione S-transferase [Rhodocyclaceae bacterium]